MTHRLHLHSHEFHPKQGGIGRYCRELALAAARMGRPVSLHGPRQATRPPADPTEAAGGYRLHCGRHGASHRPLNLWQSRQALARILRKEVDGRHLLAEPGPILAYGLLPAAHYHEAPVRLVLHGSEVERWAAWPWGSGRIARRAMLSARALIAPSHSVRERILECFPETADKLQVIPHALPETFRKAAECQVPVDRSADRTDRHLHLIAVGRIHPRKGFDHVLQALALLPSEDKQRLRLTIAGARSDEAYRQQLTKKAHRCGCPVDWRLDPDDDELAALYRAADLFVLTSLPRKHSVEGFGLVYLEAGAFGLPAIAYPTGGVADAVRHGETGHILKARDPQLLAESIHYFQQNPAARREMGARARQRALSRSWEDIVKETIGE